MDGAMMMLEIKLLVGLEVGLGCLVEFVHTVQIQTYVSDFAGVQFRDHKFRLCSQRMRVENNRIFAHHLQNKRVLSLNSLGTPWMRWMLKHIRTLPK